jgi:hypothetical protein
VIKEVTTDESGEAFMYVYADGEIYFSVEAQGKNTYYTKKIAVEAEKEYNLEIRMSEESEELKVSLEPYLYKDGEKVKTLVPGEEYVGKLKVIIPQNYSSGGLHLRIGDEGSVEDSEAYLKKLISMEQYYGARTYHPSPNMAQDLKNYDIKMMKWANIEFSKPGEYEVEFILKVKDIASSPIALYYRVWGNKDNLIYRDPKDNELGNAMRTENKDSLYAAAYLEVFETGAEQVNCDELFCYLFHLKDGSLSIPISNAMQLATSSNYEFSFQIFSTTQSDIPNGQLNIVKNLLF